MRLKLETEISFQANRNRRWKIIATIEKVLPEQDEVLVQ